MLDDNNLIRQRDPSGALQEITSLSNQATFEPELEGVPAGKQPHHVVLAGMGGSALAADMLKMLLKDTLTVPVEVVKGYDIPHFANSDTLVVTISHSGNTEETVSCYEQAKARGCLLTVMATGGALFERAVADGVCRARVPSGAQPRMSTVYHLRTLLKLLEAFGVTDGALFDELGESAAWLGERVSEWAPERATSENYAKQLALGTVGKTAVFYGGQLTAPVAYKWKISWNETAKNVAFCNQYPEFNHNEFMGWTSHPVEKPYAVFDLRSSFEQPRIIERMELSDRMLSGMRPKATVIELAGETLAQQFLWAMALADMTSIYGAILNNVDPTPVEMIERFKTSLS